jgi:hypothetical protein
MMGVHEAIRTRRSVRSYRPDPVPAEVRDRVHSLEHLNEELAGWIQHYNRRPHASLECHPPASRYRVSPKPLAPELDEDWLSAVQELRKVRRDGTVSYRNIGLRSAG